MFAPILANKLNALKFGKKSCYQKTFDTIKASAKISAKFVLMRYYRIYKYLKAMMLKKDSNAEFI